MKPGHLFVVLGATGDLTRRKLIPALYHLMQRKDIDQSVMLAVARTAIDDEAYRAMAREALIDAGFNEDEVARWCNECLHYQQMGIEEGAATLATRVEELEAEHALSGNRIFYLALPPGAFAGEIRDLGEAGLNESEGWTRLVVEKPFGKDLASATELNQTVHEWFPEESVYRIDHYLGKETVQNLLVFRFANTIFESSWNRDRIAQVEIIVAESLGVEGRGNYYESAGVLRDMVQNHLSQLLALTAMEAPSAFDPVAVRNEKVKVFQSISPITSDDVVLGQYQGGEAAGRALKAYRDEPNTDADSDTPTYAALRIAINNWRWQGVPILLRTGKGLARRTTEIAVTYKPEPVSFFKSMRQNPNAGPDVLRLTLQPEEGFSLTIDVKDPTERAAVKSIPLSFTYEEEFGAIADAYETLLADVINGDQTLFVRADEVEESWRLYETLLDADLELHPYPAGSWGPTAADRLLPPGSAWSTS
ncbi:MAG: glucose-6-phosphate dehydrogenase [Acidimicrobiia bacterium]|nr:glucose-6-phosphate dehydrogenase [Acidimicrobiia bacterium]